MRKLITITGVTLISALMMMGCSKSSEQHIEVAKEKMNEAGKEIKDALVVANNEARINASKDWQDFRNGAEHEIAAMEEQTAVLKKELSNAKEKEKVKLKIRLDDADKKLEIQKEKLKQRNSEFEEDMKTFDESAVTKNESFKREFKHDMDELGNSFKDLFKDNVK